MSTDWENQLILARFQVDLRLPGAEEAYRAWDNQTNQPVTLHLLPEETDLEALRRLAKSPQGETEIRDLERVSHPGILPYLGLFEFNQQTFWVEGYMDGPTLRFVLNTTIGQPLPLAEALTYLKSLSSELTALHEMGWAHTQLRPENIRLDHSGAIYLAGLFSAQHLGSSLPHPAEPYTAPEDEISSASDVYALACILFEMLAGSPPSGARLPDLRKINPDVPEFLARSLPRALDKNPANRISNATEFFLTLCLAAHVEAETLPERIQDKPDRAPGESSPSVRLLESWNYLPPIVPPPSTARFEKEKRRPPAWLWLIAVAFGLGAILIVWYFFTAQSQVSEQIPTAEPGQVDVVPSAPIVASENVSFLPTDSPVPTLNAPGGLGGRIVFTCTRGDLNQLCMVAPTGGEVARLTVESAHDFYPTFSPDGNLVLFASNRGGDFNLYLKLLGGDVLTQVTKDIGQVSSASFSPDGKQIVFSNSVDGKPSSLWIVGQDGKNPHMLYAGDGNIASPVWSPNGKSIAFAMSSAADLESYEVFIMDAETQDVAPLTKGHLANTGGSVDWSPDGRFLALFAGPPGDHNIYTFEIVSGTIKQLTDGGNNAAPAYSPDGSWIVFNSQRVGDNANIYIMRPDGSDVQQLTSDTEPDWQPRWGR